MKKLSLLLCLLAACTPADTPPVSVSDAPAAPAAPPAKAAARLAPLVGEYVNRADTVSLLEDGGDLVLLFWGGERHGLTASTDGTFAMGPDAVVTIIDGDGGRPVSVSVGDRSFARLALGPEDGGTFQITPIRAPDELRAEALAASPPDEEGDFLESDLVELVTLDPSIALDIRYASTNNFMGEVFYSAPRAFLQRPAAEGLVRAHQGLAKYGYGLLIHDGYRPWYVTKMFWEATPEELKIFVADPASGSRHNRGAAVDLTLFDLATGEPITMTGGYDEMSPRSFPEYPGGTTLQRWHRELLRDAMEAEGFTVYEAEWWHFDYGDWRSYRIGNERFEDLGLAGA